ncbi:MAG: bifunctional isocitrate dehydrogenase kinase/phosphatase [Planctomycetes bacterium]|nr:bifunctional isocitrate dehydrogenase kinase/phosphatase [Planctomycetota bacterium]
MAECTDSNRAGGDEALIEQCVEEMRAGFVAYDDAFRVITRRARSTFEQRDWAAGRRDAVERIELWGECVAASVQRMEALLGERSRDRQLWARIKARYCSLVVSLVDAEFFKTYFSSVTRRLFQTVGVDTTLQFAGTESKPLQNVGAPLVGRSYLNKGPLASAIGELLRDFQWQVPYEDLARCAAFVCDEIVVHRRQQADNDPVLGIDVMDAVFYRDTRAYIVGRVTGWTTHTPLVIVLANTDRGVRVDAVIQTEQGVSVLFGFTRSHFHVDLKAVGAAIGFLRTLLPRKRLAELFTALGRYKQGKTERYRDFVRHLRASSDRFIVAPGDEGMVMLVFTLPSYDVVFKVIRDEFDYPKDTTRERVEAAYDLVFRHDKAGRLVDAQEFRSLEFPKDRFSPDLLQQLLASAARTVRVEGDNVVIGHAYIERRLRPLNLYLREANRESARSAVREYGQAIRDLAATNIFAGDMLLKNFGVSRHGRVIFYDYDELCLIDSCCFRALPAPTSYDDEVAAEPSFFVGAHDVFPEQFGAFLGLDDESRALFMEKHADLLTVDFWLQLQEKIRSSGAAEVLPYEGSREPDPRRAG